MNKLINNLNAAAAGMALTMGFLHYSAINTTQTAVWFIVAAINLYAVIINKQ